ncbi:hypothetical protein ANLFBCOP_004797 [Escherichia coli]|nr:hypothetical protein [Escherichia coli]
MVAVVQVDFSRRRVHRVHLVLHLLHSQAARCQPAAAFLTHPVSQDFTFQPVEHLHQHRREHHTATVFAAGLLKGIRQAAALRFRQLTGGGFNSDEWREAPRLINRLDAGSVVLYCGQPVAVPAVPGHLRFP